MRGTIDACGLGGLRMRPISHNIPRVVGHVNGTRDLRPREGVSKSAYAFTRGRAALVAAARKVSR